MSHSVNEHTSSCELVEYLYVKRTNKYSSTCPHRPFEILSRSAEAPAVNISKRGMCVCSYVCVYVLFQCYRTGPSFRMLLHRYFPQIELFNFVRGMIYNCREHIPHYMRRVVLLLSGYTANWFLRRKNRLSASPLVNNIKKKHFRVCVVF